MSLRSMTGFGSASVESEALKGSVSVRSLNHRYLDLTVHLSRSLQDLERDVKALVESKVARGRVEVSVHAVFRDPEAESVVTVGPLVAGLVRALRELQSEHGLDGGITVSDVAHFPGILEVLETSLDEARRDKILSLVSQAVEGLEQMRQAEGANLEQELGRRLAAVAAAADRVEALSESGRSARRDALLEKARGLGTELGLDDARLYAEVVRLVDRADVAEEVERLRSHVAQAREVLAAGSPAGKRLDFLAQELMREANTIGSKAAQAALIHEVVTLKSEIERFREQVQNVE